ncbi:hypothetical protein FRB99_005463 [Tulasnella sp. 403]|nr:hypothetical protein FRB99_005463 [Tulasnella sp. 403]
MTGSTALVRKDDDRKSVAAQAVHYARLSATVASVTSTLGFLAIKNGTHIGFSVARGLTTTAISLTSSLAERTVLGTTFGADKLLNQAVRKSFSLAEAITLLPIEISEQVTNATLSAASTSIEGISFLLGLPKDHDSDDCKFTFSYLGPSDVSTAVGDYVGPFSATAQSFAYAIPSLVRVLQHEWSNPRDAENLPGESYSALSIARALVTWATIQSVTRLYHEKKWFSSIKEIPDWEWRGQKDPRQGEKDKFDPQSRARNRSRRNTMRRKISSIHVVSDVHLPNHGGEILTAEIGEPSEVNHPYNGHRVPQTSFSRASLISMASTPAAEERPRVPYPAIRHALRRFSRMVLGGYGGAGMILFGVRLPSLAKAGSITTRFNEDGKSFTFGFDPPNDTPAPTNGANTAGTTTPIYPSTPRSALHIDLNLNFSEKGSSRADPTSPLPRDSIPFPSRVPEWDERSTLELVIEGAEQSEDDEEGQSAWDMLEPPSPSHEEFHNNPSVPPPEPSWWDVLMGRHDQEIFEAFATAHNATTSPFASTVSLPNLAKQDTNKPKASARKSLPPTSHFGDSDMLPRFWVLTDHLRQQVVLVLRGTMTLNEVAIDLACDVTPFSPAKMSSPPPADTTSESSSRTGTPPPADASQSEYQVHQGMYALAKFMGAPGKPVQKAVAHALEQNEGYELVLCGHSLGAGVCAILGLMWADPETCLTVRSSGLPEGHPVAVFCFAPPCVMSPALSRFASSLVTSFVYSHDAITRLSLGTLRDLKRVTSWLCYGQKNDPDSKESCSNIIQRALMLEKGFSFLGVDDRETEQAWFLALRKTLEANMVYADLFPPGRIFWAMRERDIHEEFRHTPPLASLDTLRVFEVEKVEEVFGQVVFAKDMVSSHFVQNYDKVLHDYL